MLKEERRQLRKDTIDPLLKMIRSDYEAHGIKTNAVDLLEGYIGILEKYTRGLEDLVEKFGGTMESSVPVDDEVSKEGDEPK